MKKRSDRLYISDIYQSIEKIERYVFGLSLDDFKINDLVIDAVARNLEIIGEAARMLSSDLKERHPELPWSKIISLRNYAIHEYFGIDLAIIWNIVTNDIPLTKVHIQSLISAEPTE
jgi:uncharacterized protein with HEPN domain